MNPTLMIVLLTYGRNPARQEYGLATLDAVLHNLRYSGQLSVHIADDGSPEPYRERLVEMAGGFDHVRGVSVSNSEERGYGANWNLATQTIHQHAAAVLPLEDDWILNRELDADELVEALADPRVGCIRLGYLGFTQPAVKGEVVHVNEGTYFIFDPDNDETHVFAGHPRIESVAWEREVGEWPETQRYMHEGRAVIEQLGPGEVEMKVCNIPAARRRVAWPMHLVLAGEGDLFGHIGNVRSWE